MPGEAIDRALLSLFPDDSNARASWDRQITEALRDAAPAIRAQERERIREALEKLPRYESERSADPWMVDLTGVLRVLEESSDD